jgi:hypothetical protein
VFARERKSHHTVSGFGLTYPFCISIGYVDSFSFRYMHYENKGNLVSDHVDYG